MELSVATFKMQKLNGKIFAVFKYVGPGSAAPVNGPTPKYVTNVTELIGAYMSIRIRCLLLCTQGYRSSKV